MDKDELKYILAQVMDAQKYIETKNITMATLIIAIIAFISTDAFVLGDEGTIKCFIVGFLAIPLIILSISFIPRMNIKGNKTDDNIYFFGHIAKRDKKEYIDLIENKDEDAQISDLYAQIVINSKITNRKVVLFKLAIRFLFVLPLSLYIYEGIKNRKGRSKIEK